MCGKYKQKGARKEETKSIMKRFEIPYWSPEVAILEDARKLHIT